MARTKRFVFIAGLICLLVCFGVLLSACEDTPDSSSSSTQATGETYTIYSISVRTEGGLKLNDVSVYIYTDSTQDELETFHDLDEEGKFTFTAITSDSYIAVLENVPEGYALADYYPLTGANTEIILSSSVVTGKDPTEKVYQLGDVIRDFTITTPDGVEYTLSQVLAEKKAVMLNFWYTTCNPCKSEFPHIQQAYEAYSDGVQILAMSPIDTSDTRIADFQAQNGLTFPMAKCDSGWGTAFEGLIYPTTVIIDRYGVICLIERGALTSPDALMAAFELFTADDYVQTLVKDIDELVTVADPDGSAEYPFEHSGSAPFQVAVEAGGEIYYNLYKVNDLVLRIQDENAYVIYNGTTYNPTNGAIALILATPDPMTPVQLVFGNAGDAAEVFDVILNARPGSVDAPYTMNLGQLTVNLKADAQQGVYYSFTASADGVFKLALESITEGVACDLNLTNLQSFANRTLLADGVTDEETGIQSVSIEMNAGDELRINIAALPDDTGSIPTASISLLVSYEEKQQEEQKNLYTITVTDDDSLPASNVSLTVTSGGNVITAVTDEFGVATFELAPGVYPVNVQTSELYAPVTTQYLLTSKITSINITVYKLITYTVKVVDVNNQPIPSVSVTLGSSYADTDETGVARVNAPRGNYDVVLRFPADSALRYSQAKAVVSNNVTSAVVVAAPAISGESDSVIGQGTYGMAYIVGLGGTYVDLTENTVTYFLFRPTQSGIYQFTSLDTNAALEYWGADQNNISNQSSSVGLTNNTFALQVTAADIGKTYVLGIRAWGNVPGAILKITRASIAEEYVIRVVSDADVPVEGVTVRIYSGSGIGEALYEVVTDAEGNAKFTAESGQGFIAKLSNVPEGLEAEQAYMIGGQSSQIRLTTVEIPPVEIVGTEIGQICPSGAVNLIVGNTVSTETINPAATGKITVVNFWGVWCSACISEMPHFDQIATEYAETVNIVAIHSDTMSYNAPGYVSLVYPESQIIFAVDNYNEGYYTTLGGDGYYPYTLILDENGVILYKQVGAMTYESLKSQLDAALSKSAVG